MLFTVQSKISLIPSLQSNFVGTVTQVNLPAHFWNLVKADGGDVRLYLDEAKTLPISFQVAHIDAVAQVIIIWFRVPTLLSSVATAVYVEVGDAAKNLLPTDNTNGTENVWSDGHMIAHLNSLTPVDSTGNRTLVNNGATITTGKFGNALSFSGGGHVGVGIDGLPYGDYLYNFWVRRTTTGLAGSFQALMGDWFSGDVERSYIGFYNANILFDPHSSGNEYFVPSPAFVAGQDYMLSFARTGSTVYIYIDGVLLATTSDSGDPNGNRQTNIGAIGTDGSNGHLEASMSEAWVLDAYRDADWISTTYANQNDPLAFWGMAVEVIALEVNNAAHAHTADQATLSQSFVLDINSSKYGFSSDQAQIEQTQSLSINNALNVIASENVALSQGQQIIADSAVVGLTSDEVFLSQGQSLFVMGAHHTFYSDQVALSQYHEITVNSATHEVTDSEIQLNQQGFLSADSGLVSLLSGTVMISQGQELNINDTAHTYGSDQVYLFQPSTFTISALRTLVLPKERRTLVLTTEH